MPPSFLIADDSPGKLQWLVDLVTHSSLECDVLTAMTTEEAKRLINENPEIAYAFIDYNIPSEDGPAIIAHLHAANAAARIALVTANDPFPYKQIGEEAGANAFVCTSDSSDIVEKNLKELLMEWEVQ